MTSSELTKERFLMEEHIKDLIIELKITRYLSWPLDQPKTYGNSVTEEEIDIKTEALFAKDAQQEIWKLTKQHPEYLLTMVNQLVAKGIAYHQQQLISTRNKGSDRWTDNQLSSQIVANTIIGIGPDALPFLESNQDKYAKDLAKKLHQKVAVQNFKDTLKKIRSRFNL
jgi:hypothetical protein